jgi:hypothetical protein
MTICEAIIEAIKGYGNGDTFSLIELTELIGYIRGKLTTDGSVSRRLREFNSGKYDKLGHILRWQVERGGVYKIVQNSPISEVIYPFPKERLFL